MKRTYLTLIILLNFSLSGSSNVPDESSIKQSDGKIKKWFHELMSYVQWQPLVDGPVKPNHDQFIQELQHELELDEFIINVQKMNDYGKEILGTMNAVVYFVENLSYVMVLSEEWFDSLSSEEKRALIGHELMHIKKGHINKTKKLAATLIILSTIFSQTAYRYLNKNFFISRCSVVIGVNVLSFALFLWYSRKHEKEADLEAAKELNCAEGAVALWKNYVKNNCVKKNEAWYKRIVLSILWPLRAIHPETEERIRYLENLAKEQAQVKQYISVAA